MNPDVVAASTYFLTMALGIAARTKRRSFGKWHHVMYGLCCVTLVVAIIMHPSSLHVVPVAALLMLPLTRPRISRTHDMVGVFGALGYAMLIRM